MQIQQANYYKIIGRDTNSLQANTRRAPHDLIMLVIIDPWGEGRGRREPPPPPPPTTPFLFFSLLKVNFPLRLPPFAVQIPLPLSLLPLSFPFVDVTQSLRIVTSIDYVKVKPPSLYNKQR